MPTSRTDRVAVGDAEGAGRPEPAAGSTSPDGGLLRRLRRLAGPTPLLATGLVIAGAAGSGFLAVVNRSVPPSDVVALQNMYFLLATIGTGAMLGLEQEMTRVVSRARALGMSPKAAVRRQLRQAAWLSFGTVAIVAAVSPVLVSQSLHGYWWLLAELLIGLAGTWLSYLVRGLLAGREEFTAYSASLLMEGVSRLVPSAILLVLNVRSAWLFGLFFALGAAWAALAGLVVARFDPRRRARVAQETAAREEYVDAGRARSDLALLTGATLASQILINVVPLLVGARFGRDHGLAPEVAAISSAVGLTRLGLLVLFPLQAPLLPKLTAAAARGDLAEVRRRTTVLTGFAIAAGLLGVLVCAVLGPRLLTSVWGTKAPLPGILLAGLAAGTMFLMVGYVLQSALLALNRHMTVLLAWTAGVAVTIPVFVMSDDVLITAGWMGIAGGFVAAAWMAVDVVRRTGRGATAPTAHDGSGDLGSTLDSSHVL